MENFLQYQHENNYIRRHDFQQHPKENYKMSMHSLRKNNHAENDRTLGRIKHLLRRRADGRSVHTPDHIESHRRRHELFSKLSPPKFDIIKVRHLDQRHHEKYREKLKNKEKRRIERAHRRKYQNGKSIANPINHMHHDTGTHAEFIPRKPGRKLSKYDPLSSYNVGRALLHAPGQAGQAGRSRPSDGNTKCFCRRNNNNRLPLNSLLYGWGAVSERISNSGRVRTGKKLVGPSLKAALALSPRAYPDRLPKHLEVRRRPQEEYRAERKEVRRLRKEKEEAKKKKIMMNKKKGMLPKEDRSRRHQQNVFVLEHDLLKELKQSILHLPRLSSQSQSAR